MSKILDIFPNNYSKEKITILRHLIKEKITIVRQLLKEVILKEEIIMCNIVMSTLICVTVTLACQL